MAPKRCRCPTKAAHKNSNFQFSETSNRAMRDTNSISQSHTPNWFQCLEFCKADNSDLALVSHETRQVTTTVPAGRDMWSNVSSPSFRPFVVSEKRGVRRA